MKQNKTSSVQLVSQSVSQSVSWRRYGSVAILAQFSSQFTMFWVVISIQVLMTVSRPCNIGPVPPVNESLLVNGMKSYIDSTPRDADVFEWRILAGVSKGGGVPYQAISDKSDLIACFLSAAPAARITNQTLKRAFHTAIAAKNMRSIFPNTPRLELVKILCRTVAMGSNQHGFNFI